MRKKKQHQLELMAMMSCVMMCFAIYYRAIGLQYVCVMVQLDVLFEASLHPALVSLVP